LFIIEVAKLLEGDPDLKKKLDDNIPIIPYKRLYNHKPRNVRIISRQIKHFRDACVHHKDEEISKWPEFKEFNLSGGDSHLDPTHDYKTHTPVFVI
jgi:hypothetical protein